MTINIDDISLDEEPERMTMEEFRALLDETKPGLVTEESQVAARDETVTPAAPASFTDAVTKAVDVEAVVPTPSRPAAKPAGSTKTAGSTKPARPTRQSLVGAKQSRQEPERKPFRNKAIKGNKRRQFALGVVPSLMLFAVISAFIWGWAVGGSPLGGFYVIMVPLLLALMFFIPVLVFYVAVLLALWMIVEAFGIEAKRETYERVKEVVPTSTEAAKLMVRNAMYKVI